MPPPPAATAPAHRHTQGSPSRRWGRGAVDGAGASSPAVRRAPLRVVPSRRQRGARVGRAPWNNTRLLTTLAVSVIVGALLAVVVGQALLANGQVRLSSLQHALSAEQSAHRQSELAVSGLETPARIVAAATSQLQMVHPGEVVELPYVPLNVPLPTPKVTPAPASPPPPASTAGAAATGSGTTTTPTSTP